MGNVTDVRRIDLDHALLTETDPGGWFGTPLLRDEPLLSYVPTDEGLRYVLRNRTKGLVVDGGESERAIAPDRGYQALAAVTDVHVRFLVGQADGDEVEVLALADVERVGTAGGLLASALVLETADERYEFPCRGTVGDVAEHIQGAVGVWHDAYRALEDARYHLDDASAAVEDSLDDAFEALEHAEDALATAREALSDLGDGALAAFGADATPVEERARTLPRRLLADRARLALDRGRTRRDAGEYETAYDLFEAAVDACDQALAAAGEVPPDETLELRRETVREELQALRAAPLVDAYDATANASVADDPAVAAGLWETGIECYRQALGLDWGRDEDRFDGDRERLPESIVAAIDEYVQCRRAVAARYRDAARVHRTEDDAATALAAYEVALSHLERAREVANGTAPDHERELGKMCDLVAWERDAAAGEQPEDLPFDPGDPIDVGEGPWATE